MYIIETNSVRLLIVNIYCDCTWTVTKVIKDETICTKKE